MSTIRLLFLSVGLLCVFQYSSNGEELNVNKVPSLMRELDGSSSILYECKDIREIFIRKGRLSDWDNERIYVHVCGDVYTYSIRIMNRISMKKCLLELDKVRPRKDGRSYLVIHHPQIKLIQKNSVKQSPLQEVLTEEFINQYLYGGDILYISCYD